MKKEIREWGLIGKLKDFFKDQDEFVEIDHVWCIKESERVEVRIVACDEYDENIISLKTISALKRFLGGDKVIVGIVPHALCITVCGVNVIEKRKKGG